MLGVGRNSDRTIGPAIDHAACRTPMSVHWAHSAVDGTDVAVADVGERLQLFVDQVREYAIFLLGPEGAVASWNPGATRLYGYGPDEILGCPLAAFFSSADVAAGKPDDTLARAARDGTAATEGWHVRKDGSRFWAYGVVTALRAPDGGLRGYAKVTRDDTEVRACRARAAALQEINKALLEDHADDVLALLARRARELCGAATTWITVSGADPGTLHIAAADGPDLGFAPGQTVPCAGTVAERVLSNGTAQLVADVSAESSCGSRLTSLGPALAVPLLAGSTVLGALVAAAPANGPSFRPIDLDMLGAFAAQAAVALAYERTQRALRNHVLGDDHERIARDLQHGAIRRLFGIGLALDSLIQRLSDCETRSTLSDMVDEIDASIRELREAVFHGTATREPMQRSAAPRLSAVVPDTPDC